MSSDGINLITAFRGNYAKDPTFDAIIKKPKEFRNFVVEDEIVYLMQNGRRVLCVPKILVAGRSAREIIISEAHSMLAHLGATKTVNYLRDHVWWKDMVSDTKAFCDTCMTCKRSKPSNQKPYGLLNPLKVPSYPWESIGVDFVGPLPESSNRDGSFDSITVIICLLTAMVQLIPSRTNYNARQIAELMFEEIYKHFGLPRHIISDRDVLFTSTFWKRLHELLGTKLDMSSAYHPESDGSTERANRTVTQMLRQCVDNKQTDWVSKLPAIQFAINSARSESTGFAPFFLNIGRMPRSMIWNSAPATEFADIRNFALQKKLAIMSAHDSILAARVKQIRNANRKRVPAPFKEGDLVYLSTKNISFPKGLARKLIPKYVGPYRIMQDFKNQSFRIELPADLRNRGVHDVFHAALLRIHQPNDDRLFPGRLDAQIGLPESSEQEWAVDKILSHSGAGREALFEIKWKAGDITWLPYDQISHLQPLEAYLQLLEINDIAILPAGIGKPPEDDLQISLSQISFLGPSDVYKEEFLLVHPHHYETNHFPTSSAYMSTEVNTEPIPTTVDHPRLRRLSDVSFAINYLDPQDQPVANLVHAASIIEFVNFDAILRANQNRVPKRLPLGFELFSAVFNGDYAGPERFAYYCEFDEKVKTHGVPVTCELFNLKADAFAAFSKKDQAFFDDLIWVTAKQTVNRQKQFILNAHGKKPYSNPSTNAEAGSSKPKAKAAKALKFRKTKFATAKTIPANTPVMSDMSASVYADDIVMSAAGPAAADTVAEATPAKE
jgi:hypothetical protein